MFTFSSWAFDTARHGWYELKHTLKNERGYLRADGILVYGMQEDKDTWNTQTGHWVSVQGTTQYVQQQQQ